MSKEFKETNLAVVENFNPPALFGNEAIAEEMDGLTFNFDRVKIPSGGGTAFEVPGDDPENPDVVKEIVGVIVDHHPVNAYWAQKFNGQNNPPDCSALDGKTGKDVNGSGIRACQGCPLNAFGSDEESGGKACKNMHRIYILPEGAMFPLLVTLPPTSLKNFSDYIVKRVLAKNLRSAEVITKITLRKEQNKNGIAYSQAQFAMTGKLTPEAAAKVAKYSADIKPITRRIAVAADDYANGHTKDLNDINMGEAVI